MKLSKAPNVKAPRFRGERDGTVNSAFCKTLRSKVSSAKSLSDAEIKRMIYGYNGLLWQTVIDVRDGIEMPAQLGHVFIGTCPKKKGVNMNYKLSKEYETLIQHRNWESDNYLAKIFYTSYNSRYSFRHKELWSFKPTRSFTREVARTYPILWKKYLQVDPRLKISAMFRKHVDKQERQEVAKQSMESYNEFEI